MHPGAPDAGLQAIGPRGCVSGRSRITHAPWPSQAWKRGAIGKPFRGPPMANHSMLWSPESNGYPTTSYSEWFTNMVQSDVRKAIRKSLKRGVTVEEVRFDDNFVKGIQNIYNETTLRQGKPFWHYGKDLDTVRRDNSTYFDRSCYIGAYYEDELIGFIRMIVVDRVATTLQVIAQQKYFGKKPTNALIAKAVEVCEKRELSHLVYGSYVYTDPHSSLTEFKRRNGFQQMLIPRYCIPLTRSGAVSLSFGLHRPASRWMPYPIIRRLRDLRDRWNYRRLKANPKS